MRIKINNAMTYVLDKDYQHAVDEFVYAIYSNLELSIDQIDDLYNKAIRKCCVMGGDVMIISSRCDINSQHSLKISAYDRTAKKLRDKICYVYHITQDGSIILKEQSGGRISILPFYYLDRLITNVELQARQSRR